MSWCFLVCFLMKRKLKWRNHSTVSMSSGACWQFCQNCHLRCWKLLTSKLENAPSKPHMLLNWLACSHPSIRCPLKWISLSDLAYFMFMFLLNRWHKIAFWNYCYLSVSSKLKPKVTCIFLISVLCFAKCTHVHGRPRISRKDLLLSRVSVSAGLSHDEITVWI